MARVVVLDGDDDPDPFYVNEDAVGPSCPNRRDDVMLVQLLLRVLSDRDKRLRPAGSKDLQIDGIFNADTAAYIKQYVAEGNRQQAGLQPVADDGRVDSPFKTNSLFSPVSQQTYVMVRMNLDFKRAFPKTGLAHFAFFPAPLKKSLFLK
jgi:hypothetical protein